MKRALNITIAVALATATTLGALTVTARLRAQDAARNAVQRGDRDIARAVRDVEVMRRILAKEALGVRAASTDPHVAWVARSAFFHDFQSNSADSSEAFFVEGQGAIFVLRTSDPVTPPASDPDAATTEEPTLWDSTLADVEGRPRRTKSSDRASKYDGDKVRSLEDRILAQFARFGAKMTELRPEDSITVIVVGRSGESSTAVAYVRAAHGITGGGATDATGPSGSHPIQISGPGRTVRTIRLSMQDVRSVANTGGGADALRGRATIEAY